MKRRGLWSKGAGAVLVLLLGALLCSCGGGGGGGTGGTPETVSLAGTYDDSKYGHNIDLTPTEFTLEVFPTAYNTTPHTIVLKGDYTYTQEPTPDWRSWDETLFWGTIDLHVHEVWHNGQSVTNTYMWDGQVVSNVYVDKVLLGNWGYSDYMLPPFNIMVNFSGRPVDFDACDYSWYGTPL